MATGRWEVYCAFGVSLTPALLSNTVPSLAPAGMQHLTLMVWPLGANWTCKCKAGLQQQGKNVLIPLFKLINMVFPPAKWHAIVSSTTSKNLKTWKCYRFYLINRRAKLKGSQDTFCVFCSVYSCSKVTLSYRAFVWGMVSFAWHQEIYGNKIISTVTAISNY